MENSSISKLFFTSDPSCHRDISRAVESLLISWFPDDGAVLLDVASVLGKSQLRDWINSVFFDEHLRRHSKSRRQAPLYWPISTKSGLYTVWIYYHNLDDQTLFTVVNDLLDPKIKELDHLVNAINAKADKSRLEHTELERLGILASELAEFRSELLRVAKIWKPNRDDGVQITAAPLWQFFVHSKWRETLKKTWADLVDGKYEWAHIAFYIWPERVVRTAHKDRSIAIAHSLEDALWHEVEIKKSSKTGRVTVKVEWQPRELSEKELDAIVAKVKSGEVGSNNTAPAEVANG
jgi:hypothetical protein